jgi:hypothetical protein
MKRFVYILSVLSLVFGLAACGGGGGDGSPTTPTNGTGTSTTPAAGTSPVGITSGLVTSAVVGSNTVDFSKPIPVLSGDLVDVKFPSGASASSKSSVPGTLNIISITNTQWKANLNYTPGTVVTLTISSGATIETLTFNVESSAYQGTWNASYTGGDSGTCTGLTVSSVGAISGSCTSASLGGSSISVSGRVAVNGDARFTAGNASTGATFTGTLTGATGSGTWVNTGISGTWSATKNP